MLSALSFLFGCSEREEPIVAPCSTPEADATLKEAVARLEAADVSFSLDEIGDLTNLQDLIPPPEDLADAAKQANFEKAIAQLNITLSELERQGGSCVQSSISDRALVHLHLGFIYYLDAMSRLLISDDPEETFIIEPVNDDPDNPLRTFDVSQPVHDVLDATEDPREYPLAFTVKERQAITDVADLIDDAVVKPLEPNIQPQHSSVDRQPYTGSAIGHLQKAASLFGQYNPELTDTVEEINEWLEEARAALQESAEEWGLTYIPSSR